MEEEIERIFDLLTDQNKEKAILYVESLRAAQNSPEPFVDSPPSIR